MDFDRDVLPEILEMLNELIDDPSVPNDKKHLIEDVITILNDTKKDEFDRVYDAHKTLEELTSDFAWPYHARVSLWKVITRLESYDHNDY